ncbi:MAG: tetratricopeptide repeat protein [Burkholderiales bacterium]
MPLRQSPRSPFDPRATRPRATGPAASLQHWLNSLAPVCAGVVLVVSNAAAQGATKPAPGNSGLDAELFYQVFVSELEFARGEAGVAYQVMLESAKRTKDEALFRRAVEIAISARAGEQALTAAKTWRQTLPKSRRAAEVQVQLLMALGRAAEALEPIKAVVELTPAPERSQAFADLPRVVVAGPNARAGATALDKALEPWRSSPATRADALVATARGWAVADDTVRAMDMLRDAQRTDPGHQGAGLLAVELVGKVKGAEQAVKTYLAAPATGPTVRLAYARRLTMDQRYDDALRLVDEVNRSAPDLAGAWMMSGALLIELGRPKDAQVALKRYLDLTQARREQQTSNDAAEAATETAIAQETSQVYLMLAQAAEQDKDYVQAQSWLDKLGEEQGSPMVTQRRASLLARQGRLAEARALIQSLPEPTPEQARSKVMAETQLLRDAQAWSQAYDVLVSANQRFTDDSDLLYEQALIAERLRRFDEMETLLRRVIALKPSLQHAYNALGYSLVDRNTRLDEARQLIARALELAPDDPFITDSLGWAEFRLGRKDEAVRLLKDAYDKRPDTEIAAHLGEVLWTLGRLDEARQVWQAGQARDAGNDVLKETLTRLKVRL